MQGSRGAGQGTGTILICRKTRKYSSNRNSKKKEKVCQECSGYKVTRYFGSRYFLVLAGRYPGHDGLRAGMWGTI